MDGEKWDIAGEKYDMTYLYGLLSYVCPSKKQLVLKDFMNTVASFNIFLVSSHDLLKAAI